MKLLKTFLSLMISIMSAMAALVIILLVAENDWQGNFITAIFLFVICAFSALWFFRVMIQTLYAIQNENSVAVFVDKHNNVQDVRYDLSKKDCKYLNTLLVNSKWMYIHKNKLSQFNNYYQ